MKQLFLIIGVLAFFSSCMKDLEEDKMYPVEEIPDDVNLDVVALEPDYRYRKYYDLSKSEVVATHQKTAWDLAFSGMPGESSIFLNSAKFMKAANTGKKKMEEVNNSGNHQMTFDSPALNSDSTAIGDWQKPNPDVYVIDRGQDVEGNALGYKKVVFQSLKNGRYAIAFANLDGSGYYEATIPKDSASNRVMFSFDNGGEVRYLQPRSSEWDLVFTQYTKTLYTDQGEPYPYLVVGVLSNRKRVRMAETERPFDIVDRAAADTVTYYPYADIIGYDWKRLEGDVENGNVTYVTRKDRSYIILMRDTRIIYKLGFTDFYNAAGRKGYPAFEFQRLI